MTIVILTVLSFHRYYFEVSSQFVIPLPSVPLERALVFPMAAVPNMWGLWNMLHSGIPERRNGHRLTVKDYERSAARAILNTSSIMRAVSLPVFVFWRLG